MDTVRPSQIYQGGSAVGVECAVCGATATSGSWRPIWAGPDGRRINSCNKCGQRWGKAGRPRSLDELLEAEARKAARGSASGSAGGVTGVKRPAGGAAPLGPPSGHGHPSPAAAAAAAAAATAAGKRQRPMHAPLPRPRMRKLSDEDGDSSSPDSPASSSETLSPPHSRSATASWHSTPAGCPPLPQQRVQIDLDEAAQAAAAAAVLGAGQRYVSYAVQKLAGSGRANHAAFWLQDGRGDSHLAVIGTDARQTGHFTYVTCPSFLERHAGVPPLRCTNRGDVQAWLAGFGCVTAVEADSVGLPELSIEERKRLLNPEEPVWSRPSAGTLAGSWRGVREESGRLADGRHFKRFWLLPGAGGQEKLLVTGVDSSRKDRRYRYFAEDETGGFAFENGREVVAWCNHILGRPATAPLEPEQARLARPLQEEELGSRILERLRALAAQERHVPGSARATAALPAAAVTAAAARAAGAEGGGPMASPFAAHGGKLRPPRFAAAFGGPARLDVSGRGSGSGGLVTEPSGPSSGGGGAGSGRPPLPPTANKLALRCATCGLTTHQTDECPLAICSPPSLIRPASLPGAHRTASLLLPTRKLSLAGAGSSGGAGGEGEWQLPPTPRMLTDEELRAQLAPGEPSAGSGQGGSGSLEAALGGLKPISAGVQRRFSGFPQLLTFVQALPSPHTLSHFRHCADKLSAHISDMPPPIPTSELDTPVGGWRWTPTQEALALLDELRASPVNLSLLESSGIAGAVAQLRNHRNASIALKADDIVHRWRTAAVAALTQATGKSK
ncbi:hypothetical protein ABPG77_000825 [Micractinium sp. CCAP 211/92]